MWDKDRQAEQLMDTLGMKWEFKCGIPISKIRIKESIKINIRFGEALNQQRVDEYAANMTKGLSFPAPVLSPQYLIYGGTHRIDGAIKAKQTAIDAYVVTTADQKMVDEFVRLDNTRHGTNLTDEQRVQTCVELHDKYGTSIRDLNKIFFGGTERFYNKILQAKQAGEVLHELQVARVDRAPNLQTSTLESLHPLIRNRNVLKSAGEFIGNNNLSYAQAADLVKSVREKVTEDEQLAVIATAKKERAERNSGPRASKPEVAFRRELGRFRSFLETGNDGKPFPAIDILIPDTNARKELKDTATAVINLLKASKEKVK